MNKSESIAELAAALSKFQGEVSNPPNSKFVAAGKFSYKYAPLDEILNIIRPLLSSNGLSIVQAPIMSDGMVGVSTTLIHKSGEWLESSNMLLPMDKQSAQGAGSAITYSRRYSISSMLGISSEDDDDANSIEPAKPTTENNKNKSDTAKNKVDNDKQAIVDNSLASDAQVAYINNLSSKKGYTIDALVSYIKTAYKKTDVKALSRQEAGEVINMLNAMGTN